MQAAAVTSFLHALEGLVYPVAAHFGVDHSCPLAVADGAWQSESGTDRGLGEAAALGASFAIALSALLLGVGGLPMLAVATLAGFAGSNVDSLVGALFENKGVIGNAGTNLVATFAGGLGALVLLLLFP